jgi:hypothetical protein
MAARMTTDLDPLLTIPTITGEIQQDVDLAWTPSEGEQLTQGYRGKHSDLLALYAAIKAQAAAYGITGANLRTANGRSHLSVRWGGVTTVVPGEDGEGVPTVEELQPIDVLKDVASAPKYVPLTGSQIQLVKSAIADALTEDEAAEQQSVQWGDLPEETEALMRDLYRRYAHGENNYLETQYIFRRTYITNAQLNVNTSAPVLTLLGTINEVIEFATLRDTASDQMKLLLDALPSGEWLVRTPKVTYQGSGKFNVEEEYQWALKWSDLYGGTLIYT